MRLEERYTKEIKDALMKKFSYSSVMQLPKLGKCEGYRLRYERPGFNHRSEADRNQGKEICRFI
mgnify:CR=1 FL=1